MKKITLSILIFTSVLWVRTQAQILSGISADGRRQNNIYPAVPFLLITPQPRAGAMGNAGVAIAGDASGAALNTASLAFLMPGTYGFSFAYSPWLKRLTSDMSLSYATGYYRFDERNTVSFSLRYFTIGSVTFTDQNFQELGMYDPNEIAFDIGYSRSLGPNFALGGNLRYINSNLLAGSGAGGNSAGAGQAISADVSALYKTALHIFATDAEWNIGLSLSNIGTKMTYSNSGKSYFLPAELRFGSAVRLGEGENKVTVALDLNKLMVPTQPMRDQEGNIVKGRDPDRSVPSGIFGSFADAPGSFSEEVKEIGVSSGIEFAFKDMLFVRGGYNYQHPDKGNLSYLTTGLGLKFRALCFDFSYLISSSPSNPIGNTLRFGLTANIKQKR